MLNARTLLALSALAGLTGASCILVNNDGGSGSGTGGTGNLGAGGLGGAIAAGKGVGVACTGTAQCRPPLACNAMSSTCQPKGDGQPGTNCFLSADCLPSLYCTPFGKCDVRVTNPAAVGGSCTGEGDCGPGLACVLAGLSGVCKTAGTADIGAPCTGTDSCLGGLLCANGVCNSPLAVAPWAGAKCATTDQEAVAKIHFKIPRAAEAPSDDFFALPFPSDARLVDGKVKMKNFPRPGLRLLPFDPIDRYIKAIESDIDGAALNAAVFIRFSRLPDTSESSLKGPNAVTVWNMDETDSKLGYAWDYSPARGMYICDRWMVLRPDRRLAPGTTYAVVIKKPLVDTTGQSFVRDADFDAMMSATMPADAELVPAWNRHKKLRDWVANPANMQSADSILVAAMFTTQKVEDPIKALRKATAALTAPHLQVKGLIKCGDPGVTSPCEDGKTGDAHVRGCFAAPANANFDEYQGLVTLPVWQKGTRPYEDTGGQISFDPTTGAPVQHGMEDVCIGLSVPKGTAPAEGWPLVVYGHGTTGSFRSFLQVGWAQDYAAGVGAPGAATPMAVLSYDGALHGTRGGMSTRGVDELVFNVLNPESARDTAVAGAADLFALAQVAATFSAGGLKFNKDKIQLYGHSQGANAAAIAAGYEPIYKSVVLSGSGATLALSLVSKQKPINIAAAIPVVIGDRVSTEKPLSHPLISVLQMYFERSDPANFVHRIAYTPLMEVGPKNFVHVYGTGDSYSPEKTQESLSNNAGLPAASPSGTPVSGNVQHGAVKVTAVQIKYSPPSGTDGHFVSTAVDAARKAVVQTAVSAARDGISTVTP